VNDRLTPGHYGHHHDFVGGFTSKGLMDISLLWRMKLPGEYYMLNLSLFEYFVEQLAAFEEDYEYDSFLLTILLHKILDPLHSLIEFGRDQQ